MESCGPAVCDGRPHMESSRPAVCGRRPLLNGVTVCLLLAVALVLYSDPFLILWWHEQPAQKGRSLPVRLDMAADSVDDMYAGCRPEAAAAVDRIGVFEWSANKNFSEAWAAAEGKARKPAHAGLRDDHAAALYVYTHATHAALRRDFDGAVMTGKRAYRTARFRYHYLYFYLADAVRLLRLRREACRATYRRTWERYDRVGVGEEMRFGAFVLASSGPDPAPPPGSPGTVSCFQIHTCFGAEITAYSAADGEGQVLIPPYEVFRVASVRAPGAGRCEAAYVLRSTGVPRSDCNCKRGESAYFWLAPPIGGGGAAAAVMCASAAAIALVSLVLARRGQKRFVAAVLLGALLVFSVAVATAWRRDRDAAK